MKGDKLIRKLVSATILLLVAFSAAGCMKVSMDLVVDNEDNVSGSAIIAFSKEAIALADSYGAGNSLNTDSLITPQDGMTVDAWEDDKYKGSKITFDKKPMASFSTATAGSAISFTREGNNILVSGDLNMAGDQSGSIEQLQNNPLTSGMFATSEVSISITLPGKVTSTNGVVEGNKVTFKGKLGDDIVIDAKADTSQDFTMIYVIVGAIVALGAVGGGIALARRKKGSSAPAGDAEQNIEEF